MRFLLLLPATLLILQTRAQAPGPLATVRAFLAEKTSPEKYLIGEAAKQDLDPRKLPESAASTVELLGDRDAYAVVALTLAKDGRTQDLYLHMHPEDGAWKIHAVRSLWLPGIFYMPFETYSTMDREQLRAFHATMLEADRSMQARMDSLLGDSATLEVPSTVPATFEEFLLDLRRDSLTIASDVELVAHFLRNQSAFEELDRRVAADGPARAWGRSAYRDLCIPLLISSLSSSPTEENGPVYYVIGGMLDNEVGYFHCPDPAKVPEMRDNGYIMIRRIAEGWYLYKTT